KSVAAEVIAGPASPSKSRCGSNMPNRHSVAIAGKSARRSGFASATRSRAASKEPGLSRLLPFPWRGGRVRGYVQRQRTGGRGRSEEGLVASPANSRPQPFVAPEEEHLEHEVRRAEEHRHPRAPRHRVADRGGEERTENAIADPFGHAS